MCAPRFELTVSLTRMRHLGDTDKVSYGGLLGAVVGKRILIVLSLWCRAGLSPRLRSCRVCAYCLLFGLAAATPAPSMASRPSKTPRWQNVRPLTGSSAQYREYSAAVNHEEAGSQALLKLQGLLLGWGMHRETHNEQDRQDKTSTSRSTRPAIKGVRE
jgi:hypothetical protein